MKVFKRILKIAFGLLAGLFSAALLLAIAVYLYFSPGLPDVHSLQEVKYQVPLRIYSSDGRLIAEYGDKRRDPLRFEQIPRQLVYAFLAAEDARFYEHSGVSVRGLLRAAYELLRTGRKSQGGSTITMQVARNFFLSDRKTYSRKIREILLALKIEKTLSKDQILTLYLNKIYLGNRAYGVGAAAHVYYGKNVDELDLAQMAMIAGLPRAPSTANPLADPKRALARRAYVLTRMRDLHYITEAQYQEAMRQPITASLHTADVQVHAPYVAEWVRGWMVRRYGEQAYTDGFKVYTTVVAKNQAAANRALRDALLAYTERHGYRGAEGHVALTPEGLQALRAPAAAGAASPVLSKLQATLDRYPPVGGLISGIVYAVHGRKAQVYLGSGRRVTLDWKGLSWARPYLDRNHVGPAPVDAQAILKPGDLIRVRSTPSGWRLSQVPRVEGALVSLNPDTGGIVALVGGFDFDRSKFDRVTQAMRQPGSSFKPFIYSAALHYGYTPASLINDAPIVVKDSALGGAWRPENYERRFNGPTPLRTALVESLNLVSIRLLQAMGIDYALNYVARFGFDPQALPHNLTLALGSGDVTPLQMAGAYAVFANGGFRVEPHVIRSVVGEDGKRLFEAETPKVCAAHCPPRVPAPSKATALATSTRAGSGDTANPAGPPPAKRVISQDNAFLMTSMLQDVIRQGTGRAALSLHRSDLAGKTGTTNDQVDAWFCGYNARLVAVAWVGFDDSKPLGRYETGARAALPMWMAYMGAALQGVPESTLPQPPGIVTVRIDPKTGRPAPPGDAGAVFEMFRKDHAPKAENSLQAAPAGTASAGLSQKLF